MRYSQKYWNDVERVVSHVPNKEKLFGKKILLTGATGMIVSCVVEVLYFLNKKYDAEIKIVVASRDVNRLKKRFAGFEEGIDYTWLFFDATQYVKMNFDADFVIHGASNANPYFYSKQPVETILGNILGIDMLLDSLKKNRKGKLLYISSSEVYGNKKDVLEYEENDYGIVDSLNLRACYPNAKRLAETLCIAYGEQYGVSTVIARPGHIYGPSITTEDSRATAQFTKEAIQGKDIMMKSAGLQRRSYCYTLDCASALLAILINGKSGEAYNVSNRDSIVSIREWAEALANYTNTKIIFENPSDAEVKGYNLMSHSVLNANKLEVLGWKAEFGLFEGIKRTIEVLNDTAGEEHND